MCQNVGQRKPLFWYILHSAKRIHIKNNSCALLINQFFSFSIVSYLLIAIYITLIYILKSKIPCNSLYLKLSFYHVIAWNFSNKAMLINYHNMTSTEIPQNISTPSIKAHEK